MLPHLALGANGEQLRALKLRCKGIRQLALKPFESEQAFQQLTTLEFARPPFYVAEVRIVDLSPIGALRHLERLVLDVFTYIDDDDVARIIAACTRLKHLSIRVPRSSNHSLVTCASLGRLPQCAPRLEFLALQNVRMQDACIGKLAELRLLRSLTLEDVNISNMSALFPLFAARAAEPNAGGMNQSLHVRLRQCCNVGKPLLRAKIEQMITVVRRDTETRKTQATRLLLEQESIFDPPEFVNVPRNMTLKLKKMRY